jgi:hypothetical protein
MGFGSTTLGSNGVSIIITKGLILIIIMLDDEGGLNITSYRQNFTLRKIKIKLENEVKLQFWRW